MHLVPFDLVALNESAYQAKHYRDLHGKLREIFGSGTQVHPIPMEAVASKQEVLALYEQWVVQENAEGLVVHSEFPRIFKIKPKQSIDAVVVGYTQGDGEQQGKIRDLLLALIADDNAYQVIAKTGTGFTEQQKEQFYVNLQQKHIESDYLETDSRNIAYRMVSPSLVVEVEFGDILAETRKGQIFNPVLCLNEGRYQFQSLTSGIHLLHPVFERIREDKTADLTGCPVAQITDLVYMTGTQRSPVQQNFPTSEVIFREVYQKKSKDKIMVLKFLAWKTNKEDMGRRHPAYVMHFTNFSSGRNDPIQRDVRVSSSRKQIMQITQKFIEKNVKKGWEKSET